jgi:preprotein translocase subunit SecA
MSEIAALLHCSELRLADGAYCERLEQKESVADEWLRGLGARFSRQRIQGRRMRRFAQLVGSHEPDIKPLDNAELIEKFHRTCRATRRAGLSDELCSVAFACIREASRRVLGMRHHDVQIMAGWALLHGFIAEMQTGEGKTLVASLPACTVAATGAATHVITVNDYLAERDAASNRPLYEMLGLTVGLVKQDMEPEARRLEYAKNILYVSNKEVVFDYLKDRIADGGRSRAQHLLRRVYRAQAQAPLILRGLHYAIVDEADSVLIDEARTPLIISATEADTHEPIFRAAIECAKTMERGKHFTLSAHNEIVITPSGEHHATARLAELPGVWRSAQWRHELCLKALQALHTFHRDQHYIIAEGKVQIVDEFTGRVMPDRSWERGLHQMIELKESCEITGQRRTLSQITYQRFFRRYARLGGMTGTAEEVRAELNRVYGLRVIRIPTHKPTRRRRLTDHCLVTSAARHEYVARRAVELTQAGRAVLIGTRSVEASERISEHLQAMNIEHQVLNARQDREEADIVSRAGEAGRITVATNMAGRGTDIRLSESVSRNGGLHVILTEFHESGRVDRQLFGRCARQGEAGTVEAIVSLEDELFVRHAPLVRKLVLATTRGDRAGPFACRQLVRVAQWLAARRELAVRMATLKNDRRLQAMLAFAGTGR